MADKRINVHIKSVERLGRGKIKVKLVEKNADMTGATIEGRAYVTTSKLGRGRYIMKEVPNSATQPDVPECPEPEFGVIDHKGRAGLREEEGCVGES